MEREYNSLYRGDIVKKLTESLEKLIVLNGMEDSEYEANASEHAKIVKEARSVISEVEALSGGVKTTITKASES